MPILMSVGVGLFFVGTLSVFALMFANGGAQKSRQFAVLGQLWSGNFGTLQSRLIRLSLLLVGVGAMTCFAGVGRMDADRAERCQQTCLSAGYSAGQIGPSVERRKNARFVACICTAPDKAVLELRADSLTR